MDELRHVFSDELASIAAWRNVALLDVRGPIGGAHVRCIGAMYAQMLEEYPHLVALCVAHRGITIAAPDARAQGAEIARRFGAAVTRVAVVLEETGVIAQLFRTIVRGISAASRSTRFKICNDVESAVAHILPDVLSSTPALDISQELVQMSRALGNTT